MAINAMSKTPEKKKQNRGNTQNHFRHPIPKETGVSKKKERKGEKR
jgi:hypothetical protein